MTPISFFEWFLMLIIYMFLLTSYYIALHYSLLFSYLLTRRSFCLILLFGKETRVILILILIFLVIVGEWVIEMSWVFFFKLFIFSKLCRKMNLGLGCPSSCQSRSEAWPSVTFFHCLLSASWVMPTHLFSAANLFSQTLKRRQQLFVTAFNSS